MKRLAIVLIGVLSLAAFPVNKGLVTDEASILTPGEKTALEQKLRAFEQKTSVEIAVVTVTSLDGMTIDEYRVKLFETWKIGKKGKDNGVLLVFAPNEAPTGKVGIEVGYGLEPLLPDGVTGAIAREHIRPGWRSDHRANGIIAGVDAIIARLSQATPEAAVQRTTPVESGTDWTLVAIWLGAIGLVIGIAVFLVRRSNRKYEEMQAETRRRVQMDLDAINAAAPRGTPLHSGGYSYHTASGAHRRTTSPPRRAAPEPTRHRTFDNYATPYEPPARHESYSTPDTSSSSSSSDSSFDFGGGSSGGGGSSNDL